MRILLISPSTPDTFWSFKYALPFVSKKAAHPPLGLLTVAGMLPKAWDLQLVDLNVTRLRDSMIEWADFVFVSAMIIHADSVHQVVARCKTRGKTVIAGGPLFTTGYKSFPEIDHFVLGEAETVIESLIADMTSGNLKHIYQATEKPDVSMAPIPRWDLIRFKDYVTMSVQFSRGCPYNCEFCDIIVMYGRVPRIKSPSQIIGELDALIDAGWNDGIFIVDDNFIGNRTKVKAFLHELIAWRTHRHLSKITFLTEASLNLADDHELLELMVRAGFKKVFVGIETPGEESLIECSKVQNTKRDLLSSVKTIQNAGLEVMGGFILGFDSDKPTIFERQRKFIQESGVVTAMVGLLTALPKTRLFSRLSSEGRILNESSGNNVNASLNFVPKLDRAVLIEGYRSLVKHLYAPNIYYQRVLTFLGEYRPKGPRIKISRTDMVAFLKSWWVLGVKTRGRIEYWKFVAKIFVFHRNAIGEAMSLAIIGYHFRKIAIQL